MMGLLAGGIYAMGSAGGMRHDFNGLAYSLPRPVLILIIAVFLIAAFGILSRARFILSGKGTATDFIGLMVVLVLLGLVVLIIGSGVFKGLIAF